MGEATKLDKFRKRSRPAEGGAAVLGIISMVIALFSGDAEPADAFYAVVGFAPGAITWFKSQSE